MLLRYLSVALSSISVLMHLLGFHLLCKVEFEPENQRLILMHLSVVEIMNSMLTLVEVGTYAFTNPIHIKMVLALSRFDIWISVSFGLLFKCMLTLLISDRTLDIFLHLRYPIIITRWRILITLCSLWFILIAAGTIILLLDILYIDDTEAILKALSQVYMIFDSVVVTCFLLSVVYLISKVRKMLKDRVTRSTSDYISVKKTLSRKLLVTCCILGTYVALNFPAIVLLYVSLTRYTLTHYLVDVAYSIYSLGLSNDAIIYILLQPKIRNYIKQRMTKLCRSNQILPITTERQHTFTRQLPFSAT